MLRWLPSLEAFIRNSGIGGYHRSGMILRTVVSTKVSTDAVIGNHAEGPQKRNRGCGDELPAAQKQRETRRSATERFQSDARVATLNQPRHDHLGTSKLPRFLSAYKPIKIIKLQGNWLRLCECRFAPRSARNPAKFKDAQTHRSCATAAGRSAQNGFAFQKIVSPRQPEPLKARPKPRGGPSAPPAAPGLSGNQPNPIQTNDLLTPETTVEETQNRRSQIFSIISPALNQ